MKKQKNGRGASANGSKTEGRAPMRGALLNEIVASFRLRQAVTTGKSKDVPEGTAKQGLNDQRDIGRARHVMLIRSAVDELFSPAYLKVRGLNPREATKHNDLVTQAVDAVLTRWDSLAIIKNMVPDDPQQFVDMYGLATGFSVELPLRLAAYDALYGFLHPFLPEIPWWITEPNLAVWWKCVAGRAAREIQVSTLDERKGGLDSHTLRDLRDGKTLPKEGTVSVLADRLAARGLRHRREERDVQPVELEFELRVAVAVAQHRELVKRLLVPNPADTLVVQLHLLRAILRRLPDAVSEDLLHHGTQATSWSMVHGMLVAVMGNHLAALTMAMRHDNERKQADFEKDPTRGFMDTAEEFAQLAAHTRSSDPRPGADGPNHRLAEFFEQGRHIFLACATNGKHEVPEPRPEWSAEMQADRLCDEAIAPWLKLTDVEKEERLREAVRLCPWLAYPHRCLALFLGNTGRKEEAIRLFRCALELNPQNEDGRKFLVLDLANRGEYAEVIVLTEEFQSSATLRSVRAHALLKLGRVDAAEKLATAILEEHATHTLAHNVLAGCLRAKGDEKGAREHERKADFYEHGVAPPGE